jgi:hypothetical protein
MGGTMSVEWFYLQDNGKPAGPCTELQIRTLLAQGELSGNTFLRRSDETKWRPASTWWSQESARPLPVAERDEDFISEESGSRKFGYAVATVLGVGVGCGVMLVMSLILDSPTEREEKKPQIGQFTRENEPPTAKSATADSIPEDAVRRLLHQRQHVANTGVKLSSLMLAMNTNVDLDLRYHHHFEFAGQTKFGDGEDVRVYRDKHSECFLMVSGPDDDLLAMEIMLPHAALWDENGNLNGEPAAAFGRCVQRMTTAVDPSWVPDLYKWMNSRIPLAMLGKNVTLTRKEFIAEFGTLDMPNVKDYLTLTIANKRYWPVPDGAEDALSPDG